MRTSPPLSYTFPVHASASLSTLCVCCLLLRVAALPVTQSSTIRYLLLAARPRPGYSYEELRSVYGITWTSTVTVSDWVSGREKPVVSTLASECIDGLVAVVHGT
jgi:hypothetical protein